MLLGSALVGFFRRAVRRRYLVRLAESLPGESPLDDRWPDVAPVACRAAHEYLRFLHHRWRVSPSPMAPQSQPASPPFQCRRYREAVSQQEYFRMREKLAASLIFRHKKAAYPITSVLSLAIAVG